MIHYLFKILFILLTRSLTFPEIIPDMFFMYFWWFCSSFHYNFIFIQHLLIINLIVHFFRAGPTIHESTKAHMPWVTFCIAMLLYQRYPKLSHYVIISFPYLSAFNEYGPVYLHNVLYTCKFFKRNPVYSLAFFIFLVTAFQISLSYYPNYIPNKIGGGKKLFIGTFQNVSAFFIQRK